MDGVRRLVAQVAYKWTPPTTVSALTANTQMGHKDFPRFRGKWRVLKRIILAGTLAGECLNEVFGITTPNVGGLPVSPGCYA